MLKRTRVAILAFGAFLSAGMAVQAESPSWSLRLRTLASSYEHEFVSPYLTTTYLNVEDGSGFEVSAELRPRQHLGVELSAGRLSMDARLRVTQLQPISFNPIVLREVTIFSSEGDFTINPFSLAVLYHPLRQGRFDLYVGPAISWVRYDIGVDGAQDRDPEPGYGVKLGGEYLFGRTPWSLGFEYRHLELLRDGTDRDLYGDIGLGVGALVVGYRFGEGIR
jgi:hypothetical protein